MISNIDPLIAFIYLVDNAIKSIIGVKPTYMRPPYGSIDGLVTSVLSKAGYKIVLWDQDTNDWQRTF